MKSDIEKIKKAIKVAAKIADIHPRQVTKIMVFQADDEITDWMLRKCGGLAAIKNNFAVTDKDLVGIREQKEVSKYVNELEKKLGEVQLLDDNMRKVIEDSVKSIKLEKVKVSKAKSQKGRKMTMELMLSDIHYGKLVNKGDRDLFNLAICRKRMSYLADTFLSELEKKTMEGYNVHKIIIALLGDIIESYTMHGLESAAGCEFGNAKQVQSSIQSLFNDIIVPIARTGISVEVPAVTGNHDRTDLSRTMQKPGESNLTWIIYNTLEQLCKAAGLNNVKFIIPEGSYVILDIYNNKCLYEHGDNVNSNNKKGYEDLMEKRARQNDVTLHFGRFGHYHEYAMFDRGRIIVNESVCGQDSYAEIKGFNTSAGQTINYYVDTKARPSSFYYSFPVYLG